MGNSEYIVLQVLYVMKIKYSDGNKLLAWFDRLNMFNLEFHA
jgi:hypothetical protein